jgi:hypothetical protein
MQEESFSNISIWAVYEAHNVRELSHQNNVFTKTIQLGLFVVMAMCVMLVAITMYFAIQNNFDFVLFNDGSDRLCVYKNGRIIPHVY